MGKCLIALPYILFIQTMPLFDPNHQGRMREHHKLILSDKPEVWSDLFCSTSV